MLYKSFKPQTQEWQDKSGSPIPEKQYTYVVGFGFIPYDAKKEEEKYIKRRSKYLAICMLIFVIAETSLLILKPDVLNYLSLRLTNTQHYLYNIVTLFLAMFFASTIYVSLLEMPIKKIFLHSGTIDLFMLFCGVGIFLFVSAIGIIWGQLLDIVLNFFGISLVMPQISAPYGTTEGIFFLLFSYIIPAIIMEIFLQGVVLQSLRPIGDGFAILATSIVATLLTGSYNTFIQTFLVALTLSFFSIKTNNILMAILIRGFGSIFLGWYEMLLLIVPDNYNYIVKNIIIIIFLALGFTAAAFLIHRRKEAFKLEDAEIAINNKESVKKFFFTPLFLVMVGVLLFRVFSLVSVVT